jgi:asparagine N-glycosylation enzyme membrane subunit Stt3
MDLKARYQLLRNNERQFAIIFLVSLAIILGAYVRIFFLSHTEYPINDGGLFYRITLELIDNGLKIPKYTGYNQANIPVAYPPLGFYLAGILNLVFDIPLMSIFRWIPAVVSILTIPAFFLLAKELLSDEFVAALAVLLFALLPKAYEWYIMGGGLTRAPGFLFLILALKSIWRGFSSKRKKSDLYFAIVFSGLTVLSHPETALYLIFSALVSLIFHGLSKQNIFKSLLIGLGVVVFTSPWWVTILSYHGLDPFLAAGTTGHQDWFRIRYLITLNFGIENPFFLSLYGVLALLGFFLRQDKISWYLALLIIGGYAIFPRGGINQLTFVVSLLAGLGFNHVLQNIDKGDNAYEKSSSIDNSVLKTRRGMAFLLFVTIYIFLASATYKFSLSESVLGLTDDTISVFAWLEQNSDKGDKVILYPINKENRYWWNDYLSEWLPALTEVNSLTTVQGYEWLPDLFYESIKNYTDLRACQKLAPECINEWVHLNEVDIRYVIIPEAESNPYQVDSFIKDKNYILKLDAGDIVIFSKQ